MVAKIAILQFSIACSELWNNPEATAAEIALKVEEIVNEVLKAITEEEGYEFT